MGIFDILTQPFITQLLNNLEVVNEMMILLSICIMHNFSDVLNPTSRYTVGWVYVWIIIATMILNFLFIGSFLVETAFAYLKKTIYTRYKSKTLP